MESIKVRALAGMMGVTMQTIRAWMRAGRIPYHKSPSGGIYFTPDDVKRITGDDGDEPTGEQQWVYYVRSSSGNKELMDKQAMMLKGKYPAPSRVIKDSASSMNDNRKGLNTLMDMARSHEVTDIAVTYPDRLSRFGVKYLERYFDAYNVHLHYMMTDDKQDMHKELMDDFMAIIASFAGKYYHLRSTANKNKLLDQASKEINK